MISFLVHYAGRFLSSLARSTARLRIVTSRLMVHFPDFKANYEPFLQRCLAQLMGGGGQHAFKSDWSNHGMLAYTRVAEPVEPYAMPMTRRLGQAIRLCVVRRKEIEGEQ